MKNIDDMYRKYGEVAEAASLFETELGNILLSLGGAEHELFDKQNPEKALKLLTKINKDTLGRLIGSFKKDNEQEKEVITLFENALIERNRLIHSFYREHNFRRNSESGLIIMIKDLESIHENIWKAYKKALLISGTDLDSLLTGDVNIPTEHVSV